MHAALLPGPAMLDLHIDVHQGRKAWPPLSRHLCKAAVCLRPAASEHSSPLWQCLDRSQPAFTALLQS